MHFGCHSATRYPRTAVTVDRGPVPCLGHNLSSTVVDSPEAIKALSHYIVLPLGHQVPKWLARSNTKLSSTKANSVVAIEIQVIEILYFKYIEKYFVFCICGLEKK